MDFSSWRTNKPQKIFLSDNTRVLEVFKPGVVFTLGKSEQKRRIVESLDHEKGWFNIEVQWGSKWIPGTITHDTLKFYLDKNKVSFIMSDVK